jgi:uncharacterized protein YjbJ (UPF0337 family)
MKDIMHKRLKGLWPAVSHTATTVKSPLAVKDDIKDVIQFNWQEVKIKLVQKWVDFTAHDIARMQGKADELCALLQSKYDLSKEKAEEEIMLFIKEHGWQSKFAQQT